MKQQQKPNKAKKIFEEGVNEILTGLLKKNNVAPEDFDWQQKDIIFLGLMDDLDVLQYANPEYSWEQMYIISAGLKFGLDISKYADQKFYRKQMDVIYVGLRQGLDVAQYADEKLSCEEMDEIRVKLLIVKQQNENQKKYD